MRSIIILCFAICFLPTFLLGQSFYEVFQAQDPHPTEVVTGTDFGLSGSIHQDWAVVGSQNGLNADSNFFLLSAGAAYVYHRDQKGDWEFYQKLAASDRGIGELFSSSVSVHNDQIIIGSKGRGLILTQGGPLLPNNGSAYVFSLDSNNVWQENQILIASDSFSGDHFGQEVRIDDSFAFVSTSRSSFVDTLGNSFSNTGSVYIFQKDQTDFWNEIQKLTPLHPSGGERFGYALDLRGSWAAVGAPRADRDAQGQWLTDAGAVYLYHRDSSAQWSLAQIITPSDRDAFDWFGFSVSIHDSSLMVGAIWDAEDSLGQHPIAGAGSAYIFRLQPNGEWVEQQKLSGPYRASQAHFGRVVEIHGTYALANTLTQPPSNSISVFRLEGHHWAHSMELRPDDAAFGDGFGQVISMSGSTLLAAASPREYLYIFEACNLAETVLRDTICPNSGYDFGGEWLTVAGTYADTIADFRGCDSIIQLDLAILPPQSNVYEINDGLTISAPGATVQWLNCLNGYAPVVGATDPAFIPSQTGSYAAAVSQYDCIDTSACVAFVIADLEGELEGHIQVFPNPTQGTLQVKSELPLEKIRLFGLQGQIVREMQPVAREVSLELGELPTGVYLLEVETEEGSWQQKVWKR